jgi:two-component system, sensor histidine kinase
MPQEQLQGRTGDVPTYDDLLRRIEELEADARRASGQRQLDAAEAAELRARLETAAAAFADLEAKEAHAQAGERQARGALGDALRGSRAKTQLLAAVGHDLRQPLMVIIGALEMLAPGLPEPKLAWLKRAEAAGARLEAAIGPLMEAAKFGLEKLKPTPAAFSLAPLFDELRDQHAPEAERKGLVLRVAACRQEVVSDPALLVSILHNLVGNAIKYTNEGRIVVGCRRRGNELLIQVQDTGVGIAEELHEIIFDAYRQVSPNAGAGFGLGLAIVKQNADLLGHPVGVRSALGKGSCFTVAVPLAREHPPPPPPSSKSGHPLAARAREVSRTPARACRGERRQGRSAPPPAVAP